jgi:UDP-glucose 4-epimerase
MCWVARAWRPPGREPEVVYMVTGGAGFIGSMLCRMLAERGTSVVVLDNLSNGQRSLLQNPNISIIEVDIRDADTVLKATADVRPDAVCHLAALHFIPYCNAHPQEAVDTNVRGTVNVLQACRVHPPAQLVFASTAAVYGISDRPSREDDPLHPLDIYGITKLAGEQLTALYGQQSGAPCASARIFNAVGPNETNPHVVPRIVSQIKEGRSELELGNLSPCRDYIDTRDLCAGLVALLDRRQPGYDVFNLGSGVEHSVRQVVAYCESIMGRSIDIVEKPELKRSVERMHLCASIGKITSVTGWHPRIALRQALEDLLRG